jgi:hypothetical protein
MQILQITPFMHVRETAFETALGFWQAMGFRIILRSESSYAYLEREGAGLRLLAHNDPAEIAPGTRGFRYYVDVRDVDAIHRELKPVLDAMPKGDVYGPVDQPYGQRELLILAPDGDLLVFGAARGKAGD